MVTRPPPPREGTHSLADTTGAAVAKQESTTEGRCLFPNEGQERSAKPEKGLERASPGPLDSPGNGPSMTQTVRKGFKATLGSPLTTAGLREAVLLVVSWAIWDV
jgi:hypothetical protein